MQIAGSQTVGGPIVDRPALYDRLEQGVRGLITFVVGQPGSGKTVLVHSWLAQRSGPERRSWVSVEREEADPQRFWNMVVGALRAATPDEAAFGELAPTPSFDAGERIRRLHSELETLQHDLILVVDDLHELGAELLAQFATFLDGAPPNFHAVLIARRDLPLGLHRHRLTGQLTEIRESDLRFSVADSGQMLTAAGISLSDAGLGRLHDRTEGWIAGLRLAALSMTGHPDPEGFVSDFSGSDRTVAEYLLAEVLERQPPEVQRLLARCSLLERVTGELADALTGEANAQGHLEALARNGNFVVALDSSGTWFRFHHLFGDLLQVELRRTVPEEIPRLHAAAATWFEANGHIIEAISHALSAGRRDWAVELLFDHYASLVLDGRQATAHALVETLATGPASATPLPELALMIANDELEQGSLEQARQYLQLAAVHAEAVPEGRHWRFDIGLTITRLTLARRVGDFRAVQEEIGPAESLIVPTNPREIVVRNDIRALTMMNLGIVEVWSGRDETGARRLAEAAELAGQIGRPYLQIQCVAHRAQAIAWRNFTQARQSAMEAIDQAEALGWGNDRVIGPALVTLATVLLQAGQFEPAALWLARADRTLRPELEPPVGFLLYMGHGALASARGDYPLALARYREAERLGLLLVTGIPLETQLRCSILMCRLQTGEIDAVRGELAAAPDGLLRPGEVREVDAMLALADGDPAGALAAVGPTLSGEADTHNPVVLVRSNVLAALAHEALGERSASEDALERALDIAEPDALVLPFVHTPSRALLERHPRYRSSHGAFITEILDALAGKSSPPTTLPADLDELSDAETRVLRYLPTNLSAAEIAGEIFVSVNTVKTHMRHIYFKLGVHTRTEAVQRARDVGILANSGRLNRV